MYGLEPIAHVRQCPADDHAHRVIHVGLFQFIFDVDRENFPCHFLRIFCHWNYWTRRS